MPLQSHSLLEELPEFKETIHRLKSTDAHFAKLFQAYDTAEHAVQRIETGAEAATDERLEQLKKERLNLKDQLFAILKKAA